MRVALRSLVVSMLFACVLSSIASAAWIPNGTPVFGTSPSVTELTMLAPDPSGGAWVAAGTPYSISGSHFASDGELGELLGLPPRPSFEHAGIAPAALVPDGAGGLYVFAYRSGPMVPHLFVDGVQLVVVRTTSSGAPARGWPADGVVVDPLWLNYYSMWRGPLATAVTADGGVLVSWRAQHHVVNPGSSLRVQSIGRDGALRWGTEARVLDQDHGGLFSPALVPDGSGGALVFWGADSIGGRAGGVFGQRVDAGGTLRWGENGVRLSRPAVTRGYEVEVVTGTRGDATVAWLGGSSDGRHVYATHLERGRRPTAPRDVLLGDPGRSADQPALAPAGRDAIVAWCEVTPEGQRRVKAQRLDDHGRPRWRHDGALVCSAVSDKNFLRAVTDGREGAYVAWNDGRPSGQIQGARISSTGRLARGWSLEGTPICAAMPDTTYGPGRFAAVESMQLTASRGGDAFLTWVDTRVIVRDGVNTGDPEQGFVTKLRPDGPAARPVYPTESASAPIASRQAGSDVRASSAAPAFALHGVRPNPAVGPASVAFTLPSAAPAQLELFDVTGRRVWSRDVGGLGAGEHRVPLGDGVALAPGLYLLRLHDARHRAAARVVITR